MKDLFFVPVPVQPVSLVLFLTLSRVRFKSFCPSFGSTCRLAPRGGGIPVPVPYDVNGGSLVNGICYIEATILVLSKVLCTGVMSTSAVLLVHNSLYYQ